MTDFVNAKQKIRRRMLHQSAMGGKTHFYTSIPDPLNQQYIDGKVNDTLFRLIYTLLAQSPDFWITRNWLEDRFSPSTLQKYLPLIIKAGIVEVDKVAINSGGKPANVYHTNHPDDWDMSVICEVPRKGQCNTSDVKDSERHINTSDVNPSDVNPSDVKPLLNTDLTQTNSTHSHIQAEESAKTPYQQKAEEFSERLMKDHAIGSEPRILGHYLALISQQDRARTLEWLEAKYPEWSLYLAAKRDPRTDPALTLFNWAKFYKEPQKMPTQRGFSQPQRQEMVKTDAYLTSAEDIERMLKDD